MLRRVGTLSFRVTGTPGGPSPQLAAQLLATGGAVSPDGTRVVVRTYTDAYVWPVPGDDLAAALRGSPQVVPLPATRQGEAVTWTPDGSALLTRVRGRRRAVVQVPLPATTPPTPTPPRPRLRPAVRPAAHRDADGRGEDGLPQRRRGRPGGGAARGGRRSGGDALSRRRRDR